MNFERGFLVKPAVTRLLDRWTAEDEARQIRERNDAIYTQAIAAWFRRTDATSVPAVER